MANLIVKRWAHHLGLATTDLFAPGEDQPPGDHTVLLDGDHGSFIVSETTDKKFMEDLTPAAWAWSANIPHHVTVCDKTVAVRRWDSSETEEFSRERVDTQIDTFFDYLTADRVQSTQNVVEHVLRIFREIRVLTAESPFPDVFSIPLFLAFLDTELGGTRNTGQAASGTEAGPMTLDQAKDLLPKLPEERITALHDTFAKGASSPSHQLFPALMIRHAGCAIFQKASYEIAHCLTGDLSKQIAARADIVRHSLVHFTPLMLARSIVENTCAQIEDLKSREHLVVLDPACGTGTFLQESIRHLRQAGYPGSVHLIGRDISPVATAIADFTVHCAIHDYSPNQSVTCDIACVNSLADPLPEADVVLMNPPFLSQHTADDPQREQMRTILNRDPLRRGDLSIAFVMHALNSMQENSTLGTLLPPSLLPDGNFPEWRKGIAGRGDIRFFGTLGKHALQDSTSISVAVAIVTKADQQSCRKDEFRAVTSSEYEGATGEVIRALRRLPHGEEKASEDNTWEIFHAPTEWLHAHPTRRAAAPKIKKAIHRRRKGKARTIGHFFDISQGISIREAFILGQVQFDALPPEEQRFFRRAATDRSVQNGKIEEGSWVFCPHDECNPAIEDEDNLRQVLPTYYHGTLEVKRYALKKWARELDDQDWWSPPRVDPSLMQDERPRLISKTLPKGGWIATDLDAQYIAVQTCVWLPKERSVRKQESLATTDFVCAYQALMNSDLLAKIARIYPAQNDAGLYVLSPNDINRILVPDLCGLARRKSTSHTVSALCDLGHDPRIDNEAWCSEVNQIAEELYGGNVFDGT